MSARKPRSRRESEHKGLPYGRGVIGKHVFRVRERHVVEHLIPLMRRRAVGAAKLDLVLRGIALLPAHTGKREPGLVLPRYSWEQLHDLARSAASLGSEPLELDPSSEVVRLKRKWVGEQLVRLEQLKLVRRTERPGQRPKLVVLRDDGSGDPLDDPDGRPGNSYVTILGSLIGCGVLAGWGVAELSAYLAAMQGERLDRTAGKGTKRDPGGGSWYRPLGWFADTDRRYGSDARVRMPFSVPTLERGIARLESADLLVRRRILRDPVSHTRLRGPRNYYTNRFDSLGAPGDILEPPEFERELHRVDKEP